MSFDEDLDRLVAAWQAWDRQPSNDTRVMAFRQQVIVWAERLHVTPSRLHEMLATNRRRGLSYADCLRESIELPD